MYLFLQMAHLCADELYMCHPVKLFKCGVLSLYIITLMRLLLYLCYRYIIHKNTFHHVRLACYILFLATSVLVWVSDCETCPCQSCKEIKQMIGWITTDQASSHCQSLPFPIRYHTWNFFSNLKKKKGIKISSQFSQRSE